MHNIGKKDKIREQQAIEIVANAEKLLQEKGQVEYYNTHFSDFDLNTTDDLMKCYTVLLNKYYLAHANQDEYFLDVGCGVAPTVFRMEKMGYISTGLEPSPIKLAFCDKLRQIYNNKRVLFYGGVGERLPFAPKWFDVVNSTMVLENTRSPWTLWEEMAKVAKVVTGIIHIDDQKSSPHHSWYMPEKEITRLLDCMIKRKVFTRYEIDFINEGHARCAIFIAYTEERERGTCANINPQLVTSALSMRKEWENSYYEAILEYGKHIVEDSVNPISVRKTIDSQYIVDGDGSHRINALKRTDIEKVRVYINAS